MLDFLFFLLIFSQILFLYYFTVVSLCLQSDQVPGVFRASRENSNLAQKPRIIFHTPNQKKHDKIS